MSSRFDVPREGGAVPLSDVLRYPSERSFVVQLRADAAPEQAVVRGRVEHVVSSRAATFDSLAELARFFAEAIRAGGRALLVLGMLWAGEASAQRAPRWDVPLESRDVELVAAAAKGSLAFVAGRERVSDEDFVYRAIVAALDAATGRVLWLREGDTATGNAGGADWDSVFEPLALEGGVVVTGGRRELDGAATEGVVRAYDQRSGTLLWNKAIAKGDSTEVAAADGIAFAATTRYAPKDVLLQAFELATGALLWEKELGADFPSALLGGVDAARGVVAVAVSRGGEAGGVLVSARAAATGALVWDDVYAPEGERAFGSALLVAGRRLVLGGVQVDGESDADDVLLAYDLKRGTPLWTRADPQEGSQQVLALAAIGNRVVSLTRLVEGYLLRARQGRTGAVKWDEDLDLEPAAAARGLAARGGRVVFAHPDGVFAFDATRGQRVWDAARGAFAAAIQGDAAFVAGAGGAAAYSVR